VSLTPKEQQLQSVHTVFWVQRRMSGGGE